VSLAAKMAKGRKGGGKSASLAQKTELAFQDDSDLLTPGPARDKLLDSMKAQGAGAVRVNVIYGKVRKGGGYDFSQLDDLVQAARSRGLAPQFTLMSTPRYNPGDDQGLAYNHNDPRLWQDFSHAVASHFKGRVARYSIGNEANFDAFQAGAQKDPRAAGRTYRGIYRAGYAGVKAADHGAQVLLGELTSGGGDPAAFLKGVLGGKTVRTDGLAYHPYERAAFQLPGAAWDIHDLPALQKVLASYKRQGKLQTAAGAAAPLYLTEMGYKRGSMPEAQRMAKITQAFQLAQRAGARQYLQYQLSPKAGAPAQPDGYGGGTPAGPAPAWDTSVGDAAGNLPQIFRRVPARPIARAAATRPRRRPR
jgi:hypothetical protein